MNSTRHNRPLFPKGKETPSNEAVSLCQAGHADALFLHWTWMADRVNRFPGGWRPSPASRLHPSSSPSSGPPPPQHFSLPLLGALLSLPTAACPDAGLLLRQLEETLTRPRPPGRWQGWDSKQCSSPQLARGDFSHTGLCTPPRTSLCRHLNLHKRHGTHRIFPDSSKACTPKMLTVAPWKV